MKRIVYLLGTDGSGKTTVANKLIEEYKKQNKPFNYFYARHFPFFIKIFKIFGKKTALKNTDEFNDYDKYKNKKNEFFENHKTIARLYAAIWFIDYCLITYLRFIPFILSNKNIIVDRFYIDIAININDSTCLTNKELNLILKLFQRIFPVCDLHIFIDVSPEVAFKRKNDIQSIRYLEEKRNAYLELANKFNIIFVNGENSPEKVLQNTKKIIDEKLFG